MLAAPAYLLCCAALFLTFLIPLRPAHAVQPLDRQKFVKVGDPGNPPPRDGGCGRVDYEFAISRFETTNTEYTEFLNAVARHDDPFRLFSPLMATHFWGGILRTGDHGTYSYRVKPGYARRPVTFVAWGDAIRYANWLHYGKPTTGSSTVGTTEGTAKEGAYDTSRPPDAISRRNPGAKYFLPTCDEWVKAGFYVSSHQTFLEFAGSDTPPGSGARSGSGRAANYTSKGWAEPYPHLSLVGTYVGHSSPYGTYDQNGNVMEWAENASGAGRLMLGGSLFMGVDSLRREYRDSEQPTRKLSSLGIRIAGTLRALDAVPPIRSAEGSDFPVTPPPPTPEGPPLREKTTTERPDIQWVSIGEPGNLFDVSTGYGCVPYTYEMARFEITNEQYADFLSSVAAQSDPYALFSPDMEHGVVGGIQRTTRDGRHRYQARPGHERRPATYLSWVSVARFANWLHYGRPTSGRSGPGSTEGDEEQGAYDTRKFRELDTAATGWTPQDLRRNPGARYFIPTNDEWYKAAYYDPQRRSPRKYWKFPTRTDQTPSNRIDTPGSANYQRGDELGAGPPYYVANAGDFRSNSYFGVEDLGGSVWEWLEDWGGLGGGSCWRCDRATKALRGGSFNYIEIGLHSSNMDPGLPTERYFVYGGRIARTSPVSDRSRCRLEGLPGVRDSIVAVVSRAEQKQIPLVRAGLLIGALVAALCAWILMRAMKRRRMAQ